MIHDPKTGTPSPRLADKLFRAVELEQGYAFISDGVDVLSKQELLAIARGSLKHSQNVCKILRQFLKNNRINATGHGMDPTR